MPGSDETCDVVVIGGGLVGMSLCYELVARGLKVLLADLRHQGRATDAGAGILSPETFLDPDDDWARFASKAGEHHRELTSRVGEDGAKGTGHETCGLIKLANQPGEDEFIATAAALAARRHPETVREIDSREAHKAFPPLGEVRRAIYNPAAARIDGRRATEAIGLAASSRGLRTSRCEVLSLELSDGRAVGVDTTSGRISAGAVAIAGGAWSSRFASQLDVRLPVVPLKGQIAHMKLPDSATGGWPIIQPVLSHYLVPWPEGRVAVGGTLEPDAGFDTTPTAAGLYELLREGLRTAPGLGRATVEELRVGLRPASADGRPILGALPGWPNVHVATGHGTEGLLLGPYSSALVAEGIASGTVARAITAYSPARFTAEPEPCADPAGRASGSARSGAPSV